MESPLHSELVSGTLEAANEAALIIMSFIEIFDLDKVLSFPLSFIKLSMLTLIVT